MKIVYVKFKDEKAGSVAGKGDLLALQNHWVPIKRYESTFGLKKNKPQPFIKRAQLPPALSYACTVHKVQGLSLNDRVISFDIQRQKLFNPGQIYVALSRITSMDKMHLIEKFNKRAFKVNLSAKEEY